MTGHSVFGAIRIALTRAISLLKSIRPSRVGFSRLRTAPRRHSRLKAPASQRVPGRTRDGMAVTDTRRRVGMRPAGNLASLYPASAHVAPEPRGGEDDS